MPRVTYTLRERMELVSLHLQGLSFRRIVDHFAAAYPDRPIPSMSTVQRIIKGLRETGNLDPKNREKTCRPTRRLSEETKLNIILAVGEAHGKKPLSKVAEELGVSKNSIYKTLRAENYKAYKVQEHQELSFDDDESPMIFCQRMINKVQGDPGLIDRICFTDESTIEINGAPNRQKNNVWSQEPPDEGLDTGTQHRRKVNVWVGMIRNTLLGPYFIDGDLNGESYLELLREHILPAIRALEGDGPQLWFQQDGTPPHFTPAVRAFLNEQFPNRWIGRGGPVQWPPLSPDLSPLDDSLWSYLKDKVYAAGPTENLETLRERIMDVLANLSLDKIQDMNKAFYNQLGQESGMYI